MKKDHIYALIGGTILAATLLSATCFGTNKHILIKLKGNVLYATHLTATNQNQAASMPVVGAKNRKNAVPVAVKNSAPVVNDAVVNEGPEPGTVKHQFAAETTVAGTTCEQRLEDLHTLIFGIYPGTYLDSMSIVNQLLNDSIRHELTSANGNDRKEYLNSCLVSSIHDSITLDRLSRLSSVENTTEDKGNGALIAHCKDASNDAGMDSVVMDVFSGSTLMASASSDKNGTITYSGIPEGNYYVVFSRKSYTPFSLMRVKVSEAGQSYLDVPLTPTGGYLFRTFGKNAWLFIVTGIIIVLSILTALAYSLAKYNAKKALRTA